ncbi:hypothetical protein I4U23_001974 [Adineta vaga]|nr:hypothetical protein I4U23_001974 [Adineta vaga]
MLNALSEKVIHLNKYANFVFECSAADSTTSFIGGNEVWYQRSIDISLEVLVDIDSRQLLIDKCKIYYEGNSMTEKVIEEFEKTYSSEKAVWWYTRDSFLYRIINGALRQKQVAIIQYLQFFLRDMYNQLLSVHNDYLEYFDDSPLRVYRGQLMTREEVVCLEKFAGFTYSINCFFSTTKNRSTALIYSGHTHSTVSTVTNYISVLFEIEADPHFKRKPFGPVGHLSYFGWQEDEVLFMIGALFLLTSSKYDEKENVHIFRMKLVGDQNLPYPDHQSLSTISMESHFINVGYLIQNSYLHKNYSDKYYQQLLNNFHTVNKYSCASHVALGWIACENGDYDLAMNYQKIALQYYEQLQLSSTDLLVNMYNCLGEVYRKQDKYEQALSFYSKAEEQNCCNYLTRYWINLDGFRNISLIHIASIYKLQQKFDFAWRIYQQIVDQLIDIDLHKIIFEYILKAYYASLENRKSFIDYIMMYLPTHYELLVHSYVHIVELAIWDKNYDFAIDCLKSLLEIELKSGKGIDDQEQHHYSNTPLLYKRIGCIYREKGDVDLTIEWFEKALGTSYKLNPFLSNKYPVTARDIALFVCRKDGDNILLAVEWYEKCVEMLIKDQYNLSSCSTNLEKNKIVVINIENEVYYKRFLQERISDLKLGWNRVDPAFAIGKDECQFSSAIARCYLDMGNLCDKSGINHEYYKKAVLLILTNELQYMYNSSTIKTLSEVRRYFQRRQLDKYYAYKYYLHDDIQISWHVLPQQSLNNDCLQLVRTDPCSNPSNVTISVELIHDLFCDNKYRPETNYNNFFASKLDGIVSKQYLVSQENI